MVVTAALLIHARASAAFEVLTTELSGFSYKPAHQLLRWSGATARSAPGG